MSDSHDPFKRVKEMEIRSFYIRDCADRCGARVWAGVTAGPSHATDEHTTWTVYHRPDRDEQYPAKLIHIANIDEAYEAASALAAAYRLETP